MIFYKEWRKAVEELEPVQRCRVYEAIFDYAFAKVVPSDAIIKAVTSLMRDRIDKDNETYHAICERNKTNGKKGGRPKKPKTTQENPKNPVGSLGYENNPEQPTETQDNPKNPYNYNYHYDYSHVDAHTREAILEDFFSDERKGEIEQLCMSRHFDGIDDFKRLARIVMAEWVVTGKTHATKQDAYSHLISHCDKKKQAERRTQQSSTATTKPSHVTANSHHSPADAARTARQHEYAQHIHDKLTAGEQPERDLTGYY